MLRLLEDGIQRSRVVEGFNVIERGDWYGGPIALAEGRLVVSDDKLKQWIHDVFIYVPHPELGAGD